MPAKVVLKKYSNRRLYDTEKSTYVTLSEVADYIRQGRQVEIMDAKTREDVTDFILTQIILEEAKNKNILLPAPLLHLIIRYGDNLLGEFFEKYFFQTFQNYVSHKQAMDERFQDWLKMGMDISEMAQKSLTGLNPFPNIFDSFAKKPKDPESD